MESLVLDITQYTLVASTIGLMFYYLYFFKKTADYKVKINKEEPPVSVVICAKNELRNLKLFISKILDQKYSEFEVVVIVDHSDDGSYEFLIDLSKSNPILKVYQFNEDKVSGGKKEALQFGINKASYEHLLMTDADCSPASVNWVKYMVSGFSKEKQLVLGIGMYEAGENKLLSKVVQWDSLMIAVQYLSYSLRRKPYMSVGRNVAYTKTLFNQCKGFNSHLHISSGDDDLFVQEAVSKTDTSIIINKESQTMSKPSETWFSFIQQKSRHFTTGSKYKGSVIFLLGFYQLCIVLFYTAIISSLLINSSLTLLLTMFLIKNFVQASVFKRIFFKIGVRVQLLPFLFYDIIWVLLLTIINLTRITSPSSKW
jgi:biofilm PGA synthesis N-glycosyltransferase PgaC